MADAHTLTANGCLASADFSDAVAVENNIKTEVCEAPTRSRRQAERDGAAAAAFVTNGHARLKVAELTAGQIDPISLEIETAADELATLAAEAEIPLTFIPPPPPAPEAPPPSPALKGADGSAVTADGVAVVRDLHAQQLALVRGQVAQHKSGI